MAILVARRASSLAPALPADRRSQLSLTSVNPNVPPRPAMACDLWNISYDIQIINGNNCLIMETSRNREPPWLREPRRHRQSRCPSGSAWYRAPCDVDVVSRIAVTETWRHFAQNILVKALSLENISSMLKIRTEIGERLSLAILHVSNETRQRSHFPRGT